TGLFCLGTFGLVLGLELAHLGGGDRLGVVCGRPGPSWDDPADPGNHQESQQQSAASAAAQGNKRKGHELSLREENRTSCYCNSWSIVDRAVGGQAVSAGGPWPLTGPCG